MKCRVWIVLALVVGLLTNGVSVAAAGHVDLTQEWTNAGKASVPPTGDDNDNDNDDGVEGDPENWLGGQNRPAGSDDDGDDTGTLWDWFRDLALRLTAGWLR